MSETPSSQPTAQWKNAVIIGGLVGGSVLLGAIVVKVLPGSTVADTPSAEQTAPAAVVQAETLASEPETTAAQPVAAAEQAPKPAAATQTVPTPAPEARRPEVAAGANSTVSGQPGWKNVRAAAGTNYGVVDTVDVGDRLQMISSGRDATGGIWYEVMTPKGRQGWIAGQLLTLDNPNSAVGSSGVGGNAPGLHDPTNATVIGAPGSKNVRSGPSINSPVAHIAYPGDRVMVSYSEFDGTDFVWYKVYFPISGAEGWMADTILSLD